MTRIGLRPNLALWPSLCSNFLYWIKGAQARLAVGARDGRAAGAGPARRRRRRERQHEQGERGALRRRQGTLGTPPQDRLAARAHVDVAPFAIVSKTKMNVVRRRRGSGPWRSAASPKVGPAVLGVDSVAAFGKVASPRWLRLRPSGALAIRQTGSARSEPH